VAPVLHVLQVPPVQAQFVAPISTSVVRLTEGLLPVVRTFSTHGMIWPARLNMAWTPFSFVRNWSLLVKKE
jgi:hypothetical protein